MISVVYPAVRTSGARRAFRSSQAASSSAVKALASESIGRLWVYLARALATAAPTRWVGLSGDGDSGWAASSAWSSRKSRSYSASEISGASST